MRAKQAGTYALRMTISPLTLGMPISQLLLTSVLTLTAIVALQSWAAKTKPQQDGSKRRAAPAKLLQYFCVFTCAGFVVLGVVVAAGDDPLIGVACTILAAFGAVVMTPGLGGAHDIVWDDRSVSGPRGHWFPHLPIRRIEMNLEDVVSFDDFSSGFSCIEDKEGRRIIYGYWYRGASELAALIRFTVRD